MSQFWISFWILSLDRVGSASIIDEGVNRTTSWGCSVVQIIVWLDRPVLFRIRWCPQFAGRATRSTSTAIRFIFGPYNVLLCPAELEVAIVSSFLRNLLPFLHSWKDGRLGMPGRDLNQQGWIGCTPQSSEFSDCANTRSFRQGRGKCAQLQEVSVCVCMCMRICVRKWCLSLPSFEALLLYRDWFVVLPQCKGP